MQPSSTPETLRANTPAAKYTVTPQHFTTPQAAEYLKAAGVPFTPGTLTVWRHECRGPAYVKLASRVFYRQTDLDQFIAKAGVVIETADSTLAA